MYNNIFSLLSKKIKELSWTQIVPQVAFFGDLMIDFPATDQAVAMQHFYHDLMIVLCVFGFIVFWFVARVLTIPNNHHFKSWDSFSKGGYSLYFWHKFIFLIEIFWTVIPAGVILLISGPSFALLYSLEETPPTLYTVKITAHQWYWSYSVYSDYETSLKGFDSYIQQDSVFTPYLLDTDPWLSLPEKTAIKLIVTSADVLHSWAVPAFGVKLDACPGRLNTTSVSIFKPGIYVGQCSEICGVYHGFMPIVVKCG